MAPGDTGLCSHCPSSVTCPHPGPYSSLGSHGHCSGDPGPQTSLVTSPCLSTPGQGASMAADSRLSSGLSPQAAGASRSLQRLCVEGWASPLGSQGLSEGKGQRGTLMNGGPCRGLGCLAAAIVGTGGSSLPGVETLESETVRTLKRAGRVWRGLAQSSAGGGPWWPPMGLRMPPPTSQGSMARLWDPGPATSPPGGLSLLSSQTGGHGDRRR